jgi:hypothetical protein
MIGSCCGHLQRCSYEGDFSFGYVELRIMALSYISDMRSFRILHPGAPVLTRETGFVRNYDLNPYLNYASSSYIMYKSSYNVSRVGALDFENNN